MLLRHPVSAAVLATAFTLIAGVFLFARPEYRPPYGGKTVDLSGYAAPAHGWTWREGTPGFVVRTGREEWNVSRVEPRELPEHSRLLNAIREPDGLSLLVARGKCVGAVVDRAARWFCPPQLQSRLAFVLVSAAHPAGAPNVFSLDVLGVSRGGIRRIVVSNPAKLRRVRRDNSVASRYGPLRQTIRVDGNWGTWIQAIADEYRGSAPARPWRARLDFYGAHGLVGSREVALARAGTRLVVL